MESSSGSIALNRRNAKKPSLTFVIWVVAMIRMVLSRVRTTEHRLGPYDSGISLIGTKPRNVAEVLVHRFEP